MRAVEKRESLIVLLIVVPVVLMFAFMSSRAPEVVVIDPPQPTILADQDLVLGLPGGKIKVGSTTRDEVMAVLPSGQDLGRSGMYHPSDMDLYVTMSRNEEVVVRLDITDPEVTTSRGIKPNDSFDQVVAEYGPNYTRAYDTAAPEKFDAYYGGEQYVLFKVEDNVVKKIMIGGPVDPAVQLALEQQKK